VRWPAVWKARVRISDRHPRGGFAASNEKMERGLGEWRWMNVLYECDNKMYETEKDKTNKKSGSSHQTFELVPT
jgi:hypothetical protein